MVMRGMYLQQLGHDGDEGGDDDGDDDDDDDHDDDDDDDDDEDERNHRTINTELKTGKIIHIRTWT